MNRFELFVIDLIGVHLLGKKWKRGSFRIQEARTGASDLTFEFLSTKIWIRVFVGFFVVQLGFLVAAFMTVSGPALTLNSNEYCEGIFYHSTIVWLPYFALVGGLAIGLYLIRKVRDPYYIQVELFSVLIISIARMGFVIRKHVSYDTSYDGYLIASSLYLAIHFISVTIPTLFAWSWQRSTSSTLLIFDMRSFDNVLVNRVLYKKFRTQVAEDMSIENCLFHEGVFYFY
jgi:hypothetical protein